MLRKWLTVRVVVGVISVGLIAVGLLRMLDLRLPDRPQGVWQDIEGLASRDDLNVVFVLIDTLRSDRLSAYGYERETSPAFDALADSGILFQNVMAQSTWTKSSMASLWTGTYPVTNRITRFPHGLPEAVTSPAEILKDAGFRTVGLWRNGWVAPNFGFDQGFDLYYMPENREHTRRDNPSAFKLTGSDRELTEAAMQYIRSVGSDRFFLYVHYMDVHQYVYDGSVDFGTTYSDIYDNSIRWVDKNLGALAATLQDQELMKRTVLVVASDHGEAFEEHGAEGHARNLYRETTRVPLLIVPPFRLEEGIQVQTPVENVDIWPTLLDMLGLPDLPEAEGRSLVPLIQAAAQGEATAEDRARFAHLDQRWGKIEEEPRPLLSVSEGRHRLFHWPGESNRVELYDVEADPYEQENLASQQPDRVAELIEQLDAHAATPVPSWGEPEEVSLSAMERAQLIALGYAVGGEEPKDEDSMDDLTREVGLDDGAGAGEE